MSEQQQPQKPINFDKEKAEVKEMVSLIKQLNSNEQAAVKGVMIGLKMANERPVQMKGEKNEKNKPINFYNRPICWDC